MKYYVVSDLHGFFTQFHTALTKAGFFTDTEPHKLIVCGDLLDRGKEAAKMQEFILDLMKKDEVILVRGNHEDMFVDLATIDMGEPLQHHIQNGTHNTVTQLTGMDFISSLSDQLRFARLAQQTPFYRQIIPSMVNYYETEHYVFVHGWIPCIKEGKQYSYISDWRNATPQEWANARWINGMDAALTCMEDKTIVCGHWHTSYGHSRLDGKCPEFGPDADFSPYYAPGIIAIDGCVAFSGKVNVLVIDD